MVRYVDLRTPAFKAGGTRRVYARKRANVTRAAITSSQRGYLRMGGYYGRFRGRRTGRNAELKFLDTSRAAAAVAAAGVVDTNLVVIPQGVGESERNGRKCVIKSIYIRGQWVLPSTVTVADTSEVVRIMCIQDKQANGAVFTVANVLAAAALNQHKNLENSNRFITLWDQNFALNAGGGGVGAAANSAEVCRYFKRYIKCNIPIEYDSTAATGAIATQRSNSIAIVALTQGGLATLSYVARVRYSDES